MPAVYKLIDPEGKLLYIGCTRGYGDQRERSWRYTLKKRGITASFKLLCTTSDMMEACAIEKALIVELDPPMNVQFKD